MNVLFSEHNLCIQQTKLINFIFYTKWTKTTETLFICTTNTYRAYQMLDVLIWQGREYCSKHLYFQWENENLFLFIWFYTFYNDSTYVLYIQTILSTLYFIGLQKWKWSYCQVCHGVMRTLYCICHLTCCFISLIYFVIHQDLNFHNTKHNFTQVQKQFNVNLWCNLYDFFVDFIVKVFWRFRRNGFLSYNVVIILAV